jgi:hypothetical protein
MSLPLFLIFLSQQSFTENMTDFFVYEYQTHASRGAISERLNKSKMIADLDY